jgi:hypothetical protein
MNASIRTNYKPFEVLAPLADCSPRQCFLSVPPHVFPRRHDELMIYQRVVHLFGGLWLI